MSTKNKNSKACYLHCRRGRREGNSRRDDHRNALQWDGSFIVQQRKRVGLSPKTQHEKQKEGNLARTALPHTERRVEEQFAIGKAR